MDFGGIKLDIEFDEFGIMHVKEDKNGADTFAKKRLSELANGAMKLSNLKTPDDDYRFRCGPVRSYLQYRYVSEVLPELNEYLSGDNKFKPVSGNELIIALSIRQIEELFPHEHGSYICYGLLTGKLEYMDVLKYPIAYNMILFHEEHLPEPEVKAEVVAYHEKYGNDLSHAGEMSNEAVGLLGKCLIPVFCYDRFVRGMDYDQIRELYKTPDEVEIYFTNYCSVLGNLRERLDMRHIFKMLECVLDVYPRGSKELERIADAFLLENAVFECRYRESKAVSFDLAKHNPLALLLIDICVSDGGYIGKFIPAELRIACLAWRARRAFEHFRYVKVDMDEYIDERVNSTSEIYKTIDESEEHQKKMFFMDMYLKKPVLYEIYRKKSAHLWDVAENTDTLREAYLNAWNDNPHDYMVQLAGENISESDAAAELMKLFSYAPEDTKPHMIKGYKSSTARNDEDIYANNRILGNKLELESFVKRKGLNINEHSMEKLDAYVTGKLRINSDYEMKRRVTSPSNNLILIYEEESDYSKELAVFLNNLIVGNGKAEFVEASELFKYMDYYGKNEEYGEDEKPESLICVTDFKTHPTINVEAGTGSAQEREKEEYRKFKKGFEKLIALSREYPRIPFVIATSRRIFRESYREENELKYRAFKYHVYVDSMSVEQVWKKTISILNEEEYFSMEPGFKEALKTYIESIYRDADLKGMEFVTDLKNRILTLYYEKLRDDYVYTRDCIPKYKADVQTPEAVIESMNDLIGLKKVKEKIKSMYTDYLVEQANPKVKKIKRPMHMKFTGNPGTGKTTVARRISELFYSMGLVKKRVFKETKPSDLMSYWSSGTNVKAKTVIESAYGGVLFIDEAYGFINNGDRGQQALHEVLTAMENHPDDLLVIMAGYKEEMRSLMKSNAGLNSRFETEIEFEDYSPEELVDIFKSLCDSEDLKLDDGAVHSLENCIMSKRSGEFFGNAREVRNIFGQVKGAWAKRIYGESEGLNVTLSNVDRVIRKEDFEAIMPEKREIGIADMIGLESLKKKLEEFKQQVIYQRYLREHGVNLPAFSMHMLFKGNPGTGKTTVAKMIADDLYSVGILKSNRLLVAEKKDLVSGYVGKTAETTADVIKRARGGVLFIDEAYSLTDGNSRDSGNGFGHEAIEVLLTAMEEYKEDTVFIFAGYTNEMEKFLKSNPGIMSRIGYTFNFEDYTPEELLQIYDKKMDGYGLVTKDAARNKIHELMCYFSEIPNFGNGRFVDHVIHQIILKRAARFDINSPKGYKEIQVKDIPGYKELIDTAPNRDQLYDPKELTKESKRRTAIHECGHAVVGYVVDRKNIPENISVRSGAVSFGRVQMGKQVPDSMTEKKLRNMIAEFLGGRNAERVFFGENAMGVSSDYERAKRIARSMIKDYAMGELGEGNALDILKEEDKRATEIIEKHKDFISAFADRLLEEKEISGAEMVKAFKEFYK